MTPKAMKLQMLKKEADISAHYLSIESQVDEISLLFDQKKFEN